MKFQFIPYLIPLAVSFVIVLSLAVYGYKHRKVRGAKFFIISMLIGALWAIANGLEMAGVDLPTKLFWANLQYIAYAFAPVAWVMMVLQFTDRVHLVNKKTIILMSIIPLITIILVWTDRSFGLVRHSFSLDSSGPFSVIVKEYGFYFWIHIAYCYILNFATVVLLFRTVMQKNTIYKKQAFYLLVGFCVLMFSNLLYVSGLSPLQNDISPIVFSITGLIISWGIFHFRLFDLVPIARATVIEEVDAGIVVIDNMNRVIDINPRARKILKIDESTRLGRGLFLEDISSKLHNVISSDERPSPHKELILEESTGNHFYEVYSSIIQDKNQKLIARVLIINDITDLKQAREQISRQQQELAVMEERNRMARDLHDNLGQILSFSNVQIEAVQRELNKENHQLAKEYLQRLNEIIRDAHKDIREYVYNIRENNRYKKTLIELINEEILEFKENCDSKITTNFEKYFVDNNTNGNNINLEKTRNVLGTEEKMQLLNIVREALTNIIKHADAENVQININYNNDLLEIIIEDDGGGISEQEGKSASGLSIMAERARLINARLQIESKLGVGTKISVVFPL